MDYTIHQNGWTVMLGDQFNFKTATQDNINEIARLLASNTLVVAKKQNLTVQEELRVINMFKDPEAAPEQLPMARRLCVPDTQGKIVRVTGELDEHGEPGLFGHVSDLDWHCNKPAVPDRRPIVWLYGVKGTAGSKTSWNNNILSYQDLEQDTKNLLDKF